MIKKILLPLFLLTIGIIVYLLVTETIERTMFFQEEIMRSDIYSPFLNNSLRHLTPEEINNLALKYKIELTQLDYLKSSTIALISLFIIFAIAIIAYKPDFSVKKFDGITLMVAYILLVYTIFAIFKIFINDHFQNGHNATINFRVNTEIILLIITPLVFFATVKMNNIEMRKNMHQQKWITILALVFAVLSGLIVLVVGIAVLSTPDVSTFTS